MFIFLSIIFISMLVLGINHVWISLWSSSIKIRYKIAGSLATLCKFGFEYLALTAAYFMFPKWSIFLVSIFCLWQFSSSWLQKGLQTSSEKQKEEPEDTLYENDKEAEQHVVFVHHKWTVHPSKMEICYRMQMINERYTCFETYRYEIHGTTVQAKTIESYKISSLTDTGEKEFDIKDGIVLEKELRARGAWEDRITSIKRSIEWSPILPSLTDLVLSNHHIPKLV
jgi:hypothetical protein